MCAFAELLGPDFEVDQDMLCDALTRASCANIFYLPMVTKIDIFALGPSPYDGVEFSRRRKVKVRASGEELFVKAPEDTISAWDRSSTGSASPGTPARVAGNDGSSAGRPASERAPSWSLAFAGR